MSPSEMAKRRRKFLKRKVTPQPEFVLRSAKCYAEAFRALWRLRDAGQHWVSIPVVTNGVLALELYLKCLLLMARHRITIRLHEPSVIFDALPLDYQQRVSEAWDRLLGRAPAPVRAGRRVARIDDLDLWLHQLDDIFDLYRYPFEWDGLDFASLEYIDTAIRAIEETVLALSPELTEANQFFWSPRK
jgi:hypothetical protein